MIWLLYRVVANQPRLSHSKQAGSFTHGKQRGSITSHSQREAIACAVIPIGSLEQVLERIGMRHPRLGMMTARPNPGTILQASLEGSFVLAVLMLSAIFVLSKSLGAVN